jgi:hypothetical protein
MKQLILGLMCLLLVGNQAYADLNVGIVDQGLDPGKISWWKSRWSPVPVELSKINQSSVVQVSVRWTPSTDIASGILELELPENFDGSSAIILTAPIEGVVANVDYITTFDDTVTNPTAGVYGPVKIRTRYSFDGEVGQIVDANESFAMLYVDGSENTATTNLVVGIVEETPKVGETGKTLRIQFTLAYDMWKYDLVKFTADPNFSLTESVTCTSYKLAPAINYFNGADSEDPTNLACAATLSEYSSDILYIYGLSNDIDISQESASSVEILISSVTVPDRVLSTFDWTLEIIDHSNRWVMQSGTYSSGPDYEAAAITQASWAPTWSQIAKTQILPGMSLYVDISVTRVNPIPEDGVMVVQLSDPTDKTKYAGNTDAGCFVTNKAEGLYCEVDGADPNLINVFGFDENSPSQITFTTVVTFDSDNAFSITSVTTLDAVGGNEIDVGADLASGTIGDLTTYEYLANYDLTMSVLSGGAWTVTNTAGNPNQQDLYYLWSIGTLGAATDMKSGVNFKIYFPFTTSTGVPSQDKATYFLRDSSLLAYYVGHEDPPTFAASVDNTDFKAVTPTYTSGDRNAGYLNYRFDSTYATYLTNQSTQLTTVYFTLHRASSDPMSNPLVASNAETRYQTVVEISDTNATPGFNNYYGAYQFTVIPAAWDASADFLPLSKDSIAGLPAMFNVLPATSNPFPPTASTVSGRTYYIEVELDNYGTDRMGSGLEDGDDFPCVPGDNASNVECTILQDGNSVIIRASGISQITSTAASWYTTLGSASVDGANVTPKLRGFYIENDDPKEIKYITYEEDKTVYAPTAPTPVALTISGLPIVGGLTSGGTTILTHGLTGASSIDSFAFIASADFSYEGTPTLAFSDSTATNADESMVDVMTFSADNLNWATIIAFEANDGSNANDALDAASTMDSVKINGLRLPGWDVPSGYTFTAISSSELFSGIAAATSVSQVTSQALDIGDLTNIAVTPKSIKGRGADSATIDMTVKFKTAHKIPAGGSIKIEIDDSKWDYVDDYSNLPISYAGIADEDATTSIQCSYNSGAYFITGFGEVNSVTEITIVLPNLIPPQYVDSTAINFLISITTYQDSSPSNEIDAILGTDTTGDDITITTNTATAGRSTIQEFITIPMNAGLPSAVDLYLKFSFNYDIPAGGSFDLTLANLVWQYSSGDLSDYCWLNGNYYVTCELSGSTLTVYLAEDYSANDDLEMYIEGAVKNPANTTPVTGAISFAAHYGSLTIFTDATSTSFTATSAASAITEPSISIDPTNIGEVADYSFSFKSAVDFAESDTIWIHFPYDYDFLLGGAEEMFEEEEGSYYIDCASEALGEIWCTVDRRIVVISGAGTVVSGIAIDVELYGIVNPSIQSTTTGNFMVYHYDPINETAKAALQTFGTVTLTAAVSSNILIKSVEISDNTLFGSSDITFTFYMAETMIASDWILAEFPSNWELEGDTYSCDATVQNDSDVDSEDHSELEWISSTSCTAAGNSISLDMPDTENRQFTSNHIVRWNLKSVENPEWAIERAAEADWEFELTDDDTFTIYDSWTEKFSIMVYDSVNRAITSRSHLETHDGYLGFFDAGKRLFVNDYSPELKENRIVVFAGSQTEDIYITTESESKPNASKSIQFAYEISSYFPDSGAADKITLTPDDDWTLHENLHQISFRLSADIDMTKGLYYIDWEITEELHDGVDKNVYQPPVKTLVEVVEKVEGKYEFEVGDIYDQYIDFASIPIPISVSNSPDSDVTIQISVAESTQSAKVTVEPVSITFGPGNNEKYFTVKVAANYDRALSTSETLNFILTGTDAYAFDIADSQTFDISESTVTEGFINSIEAEPISKTRAVLKIAANQLGLVYVHVRADGGKAYSVDEMVSILGSMIDTQDETADQRLNAHSLIDETQEEGESWVDYKNKIYRTHLMDNYCTVVVADLLGAVEDIELTWLWADTVYDVSAYLVNGDLTSPEFPYSFTTDGPDNSVSLRMRFNGNLSEDKASSIQQQAARVMGINPERVVYSSREANTARRLQTDSAITSTDMFFYVLVERNSEEPSPKDSAEFLVDNQDSFEEYLQAAGVSNSLMEMDDIAELTSTQNTWVSAPSGADVTSSSITVEFTTTNAGQVACIADSSSATSPTGRQVYFGLNSLNEEVAYTLVEAEAQTDLTLEISGLDAGTSYNVWCVATDDLPIWPTIMTDSETSPADFVESTLEEDDEEDDLASYITSVFLLLTVFLLN